MAEKAGINLLPECSEIEHFPGGEKTPEKMLSPLFSCGTTRKVTLLDSGGNEPSYVGMPT